VTYGLEINRMTKSSEMGGCGSGCGCAGKTPDSGHDESRREFIYLAAGGMGAVGAAGVAWPLVDSMNPAADTLALATIEVDLSSVPVGGSLTKMWRGKPVFIRRRSAEEIAEAKQIDADQASCVTRSWMPTASRRMSGWWWLVCARIWVASPTARKPAIIAASMMAGSARAMARTMIHRAAL
jgi:hypothetical protein